MSDTLLIHLLSSEETSLSIRSVLADTIVSPCLGRFTLREQFKTVVRARKKMLRSELATQFRKLKALLIREGLTLSELVAERFTELRGFVIGLDEAQLEVVRSHKIVADDLCRSHWQSLNLITDQHEFRLLQVLCPQDEMDTAEAMEIHDSKEWNCCDFEASVICFNLQATQSRIICVGDGIKFLGKVETRCTGDMANKYLKTASDISDKRKRVKCIAAKSCAIDAIMAETMDAATFSDSDSESAEESEQTGDYANMEMGVADLIMHEPINNFATDYFTCIKTLISLHYKVLGDLMTNLTRTLRSFVQPENNTMSLITSSDRQTRDEYVREHYVFLQHLYAQNTKTVCSLIDDHDTLFSVPAEMRFNSRLDVLEGYHITLLASMVAHRQRLDRLICESGNILSELGDEHHRTLRLIGTRDDNTGEELVSSEDERFDWEFEDDDEVAGAENDASSCK